MSTSRLSSVGFLFLTLSWLAYDHYRPWVNFHSELLAFIGLFWLAVNLLIWQSSSFKLPILVFLVALSALIPWIQYATGISLFAGDALMSSLYLSGFLASILIGYSYTKHTEQQSFNILAGVMHSLWIAALISAFIGLFQWLNLQEPLGMYVVQTDFGDRAMGNLGQPNQLATLLLMGIVAFAYLYERLIIGRFTFIVSVIFLTVVLILTQSRAGMLSLLVLAIFLFWKSSTLKLKFSRNEVTFWFVFFTVGTLTLPTISEALLLADVRAISSSEPVSQRWRMWQQVAHALTESPWVGFGWNQTPTAHSAGAIAYPSSVTYTNAHNFVIDLLAWNGLPLGTLLTMLITYWFVSRMRSSVRPEAVFAMACLLPFAVHSMLEFPFAYAYFLITAGLMVGIVEGAGVSTSSFSLNVRWGWFFLAVWAPIGSYLAYEYFLIEEDFRVVRFENLNIGKTPAAYVVPDVWMLSHMAAMLNASRQRAKPEMSAEEIENLRKVAERFAYGSVRYRYAIALALNGDPLGASHQLSIIRAMYGEAYFQACKADLLQMKAEKYPQLVLVKIPD